jgi:GNAT superfamily N-acetyltransferase
VSPDYRVRPATLDDADVLVRHRVGMFTDMGLTIDVAPLDAAFRAWLAALMPSGTYRAWLVETADGRIVGGGGISILPWPPGPSYAGNRLAFVYNVYVDAPHRRRGIARLVMDVIHAFCRDAGITSVALNASRDGLPLYQSMGYVESPNPMMFLSLPAH